MKREKLYSGQLWKILFFSLFTFTYSLIHAQTPNERQAREIFDKVWNSMYGPQGATLHYSVNIIGIYKTEGTIWQKGKKSKYQSDNSKMWNDGKTCYVVKKKEVTIFDANDKSRDKHASKFQFEPNNYTYHIADDKEGLLITIKQKSSKVKGVSEVRLLIDRHTFAPKRLRIKVGLIHATIHISQFRSGGLDDSIFTFPRELYQGYKFVDKRQ